MENIGMTESSGLIDYFVMCGLNKTALVDYILSNKEFTPSTFTRESMEQHGLLPQLTSICPKSGSKGYSISDDFIDVN